VAKTHKVVTTCAVAGAIHTPSMSPHIPITPDQIIADAFGAAEAGADTPAPADCPRRSSRTASGLAKTPQRQNACFRE
jgi:hypothetical protein